MGISQIPAISTTRQWVQISSQAPTGVSTLQYASIPAYNNLLFKWDQAVITGGGNMIIRFNSDTGNNYANQFLSGTTTLNWQTSAPRATSISIGALQVTPNYTSGYLLIEGANQPFKTITGRLFGDLTSTAQATIFVNSTWNNTAAITTIDVINNTYSSGNWILYGSW